MKFYLNGSWQSGQDLMEVLNPYDGSVIDTVPRASATDVEKALCGAVQGAEQMASLTGYERFEILRRVADLMRKSLIDITEIRSLSFSGSKVKKIIITPNNIKIFRI